MKTLKLVKEFLKHNQNFFIENQKEFEKLSPVELVRLESALEKLIDVLVPVKGKAYQTNDFEKALLKELESRPESELQ